jgi:hypothetical protein
VTPDHRRGESAERLTDHDGIAVAVERGDDQRGIGA